MSQIVCTSEESVNQDGPNGNLSLLRSVKIRDKATKDCGLALFLSSSLPFSTGRNMLCNGLFKHRTAELYNVSF